MRESDTKESFGFREARGERRSCPEYSSSCVVFSDETHGKSFRLADVVFKIVRHGRSLQARRENERQLVSAQATVRRSRLATYRHTSALLTTTN
jgi:hypothetical protein